MKKSFSWRGWLVLALAGVGLSAQGVGCAAGDVVDLADDDGQGGQATTTTASGVGGDAAGGNGTGGEDLGPCGQDCSAFTTPPCFMSVCNEGNYPGPVGSCVVVPEDQGTACDDGMFCTVDDACDGQGVCVGGPQNTCGMTAPECQEITCDENNDSCSTASLDNGTTCTSTDLCLQGATCVNGACTGGNPKDCFFSPVPNECYVAVCDPTDGVCKPEVGNEGGSCVDAMDLCTVNKTCNMGVCQGGNPKDCSNLTQGCVNGVCDTATGACTTMPVPPGGSCQAAVDQCNTGMCDMNGNCQPVPVANGTPCNDGQICTATDTCQNGTCTGGSPITVCMAGDFCCPAGCNGMNDNDCNITTVTLSAENRGWWNSTGSHTSTNDNTITGMSGSNVYNSYFTFNLTAQAGQTVIAAELHLELENVSGSVPQDIEVYDVSTPVTTLEASGNSTAIFQDLETGNQYGSLPGLTTAMIGNILIIQLGPAAITDLQSKVGTNNFAVGVHNVTQSNWVRFSASSEARIHQLVLDVL